MVVLEEDSGRAKYIPSGQWSCVVSMEWRTGWPLNAVPSDVWVLGHCRQTEYGVLFADLFGLYRYSMCAMEIGTEYTVGLGLGTANKSCWIVGPAPGCVCCTAGLECEE